jgi:hypothetical protein
MPASHTSDEETAFMKGLLSGFDETFDSKSHTRTPRKTPVIDLTQTTPKSTHSRAHAHSPNCTKDQVNPFKATAPSPRTPLTRKSLPNATTATTGASATDPEHNNFDLGEFLEGADDWDLDDDWHPSPVKSKVQQNPSPCKVSRVAPGTLPVKKPLKEPCTRCIVIQVQEQVVNRRNEKV